MGKSLTIIFILQLFIFQIAFSFGNESSFIYANKECIKKIGMYGKGTYIGNNIVCSCIKGFKFKYSNFILLNLNSAYSDICIKDNSIEDIVETVNLENNISPINKLLELCNNKYPGTIYKSEGDKCVCENGNSRSKQFNCEKAYCLYVNGTHAKINDKSSEGWICTYNGWKMPINKQNQCNNKYPGTIYKSEGDKCVCENGNSRSKKNKCN